MRLRRFGQLTAGISPLVAETALAKEEAMGRRYSVLQATAERLRSEGIPLPLNLAIGGSRAIDEQDVEAINPSFQLYGTGTA